MYKRNPERLSKIKKLRDQGHTIDQIAAITGYPRSSVGYYVNKYCGEKVRTRKDVFAKPSVKLDRKMDHVEAYQTIYKKTGLSAEEIVKGKGKKDAILQQLILNMFEKDPETLYFRLNIIQQLIRLAKFLRIDLNDMQEMVGLLLTRGLAEKSDTSSIYNQKQPSGKK